MKSVILSLLLLFSSSSYAATCNENQANFRWRNDDGSQTSATWPASLNTNITATKANINYRIRVELKCTVLTAGCGTGSGQWSLSRNSGTYGAISTSSSYVIAHTSGNVANGTATTQQLNSDAGFVAGTVSATGTQSDAFSGTSVLEDELIIQFVGSQVAKNDTYDFEDDPAVCGSKTFSEIPRATINIQNSGLWWIIGENPFSKILTMDFEDIIEIQWSTIRNVYGS